MSNSRLKELRIENLMSLNDVAKKVGKNLSTISRYENNIVERFDLDLIEQLAELYGTSSQYLLGMTDNKEYISDNAIAKYFADEALKTLLVTDDEMAPEIPEGAYVKIRELESDEKLSAGGFYYVEFDNKKYIRMAVADPVEGVHLMPHNKAEQRITYDREYVKTIGKIVAFINIVEDN